MKLIILIPFIFVALSCPAQVIHLTKGTFKSYPNGPGEKVADSAIVIANAILNSKDFRDSLSRKDLIFDNRKNNCQCNPDIKLINGQLIAADAYTLLFKSLNPVINLTFDEGSKGGSLGVTTVCTDNITNHILGVTSNMSNISMAAAIAVNIVHEYFHTLGYCHTYGGSFHEPDKRPNGDAINWKYYREDITYRLGWLVYDIADRWINVEHKKYPFCN